LPSTSNHSLLEYPNEYHQNIECTAIGVGTAGCRIVSEISKANKFIRRFAYVSSDPQDLELVQSSNYKVFVNCGLSNKSSPFEIQAYALNHTKQFKKLFGPSKVVFIVAGLGGPTGSGISPVVAKTARNFGLIVISVAVMPNKLETHKHFFAGVALRKLRQASSGVVVIDSDEMVEEFADLPITDARAIVNERLSLAMRKLMESNENVEFGTGFSNLIKAVVNDHYSVLSLSHFDPTQTKMDSVEGAIRKAFAVGDARKASSAVLHIVGDKTLSTSDFVRAASRIRNTTSNNSLKLEAGFSTNGETSGLTTILLASGLLHTKFDDYDPVYKILGGRDFEQEAEDFVGEQQKIASFPFSGQLSSLDLGIEDIEAQV
jgi:cell division protein FtsZ